MLYAGADTPDRQAATGSAAFRRPPAVSRSEPFGRPSTQDGIVTRSYRTDGATTAQLIDFDLEVLPERRWEEAEPGYRFDTGHRADFINQEHRLEVSATDVDRPATNDDRPAGVQFCLVLGPR